MAARLDVLDIVERIAADNPSAAARFTRAVRETEELLLAMPGMGTARDYGNPALAGLRFHLVKGFRKYLIFYIPREHGIEVVRVLYGPRRLEALFRA
jgi:toxin ParE1/3/4